MTKHAESNGFSHVFLRRESIGKIQLYLTSGVLYCVSKRGLNRMVIVINDRESENSVSQKVRISLE